MKEKIVRLGRMVIWGVVVMIGVAGVGVWRAGLTSAAMADGTAQVSVKWGEVLFIAMLLVGMMNAMWGFWRYSWCVIGEEWRLGRILRSLVWGGIWRSAVGIILVLIGGAVVAPMLKSVIAENYLEQREANWLAELAELKLNKVAELEEKIERGEVEKDVALVELQNLMLSGVQIGVPEVGEVEDDADVVAGMFDVVLGTKNAVAKEQKIKILDQAQVSDKGRFVMFYTEQGEDRVTVAQITELGEMLERVVDGYEARMGLTYKYQKFTKSRWQEREQQEILRAMGIDENITETAMAVYVVNPVSEETSMLASYAGRKFMNISTRILMKLGVMMNGEVGEMAEFYDSAPAFPFVNILPSNLSDTSLEMVVAHELGHHFSSDYCYDNYSKACGDEDFVDEAVPNWMAVKAVENQPRDNTVAMHYSVAYLERGTCYKIDEVLPEPSEGGCHETGSLAGYPAYAFLVNYEETVPEGRLKILDALAESQPLEYLYEQAGSEKMREVMVRLAERNLTAEYAEQSLQAKAIPPGAEVPCSDACKVTAEVNGMATKYWYLPADQFNQVKVVAEVAEGMAVSVMGKLAVGGWEVIERGERRMEYLVDNHDKYEIVVIAVANGNLSAGEATLKIMRRALTELMQEEANEDCVVLDLGKVFSKAQGLMEMIVEFGGEDKKEYERQFTTARREVDGMVVSFCDRQLRDGASLEKSKVRLAETLIWNMGWREVEVDGEKLWVLVGISEFERSVKIYVLERFERELYLMTVRFEQE